MTPQPMTTDLWMLVATGLWSLCIPQIYAVGRLITPGGFTWAFGNRDAPFAMPAWAQRALRAHANLTENLGLFAILILVAHVTGRANGLTAEGAEIFFIARVAHTLFYSTGITFLYLRTLAYTAGIAGEILILVQLFQ
ncbi:MAG: MAPEG family protein [Stenotrophobium sp.]